MDIRINERKPSIAGLLKLQRTLSPFEPGQIKGKDSTEGIPKEYGKHFPVHLNIVIQVIGSRGDIQPFVALGTELKTQGHRVRLATHLAFRDFVLNCGLEFFDIGRTYLLYLVPFKVQFVCQSDLLLGATSCF